MMEYPGTFCKEVGFCCNSIITKQVEKPSPLTNGIVVEIFNFTKKNCYFLKHFVEVLFMLNEECKNMSPSILKSKVNSVLECKKKLVSKKKVPSFQTLELLNKDFNVCLNTVKSIIESLNSVQTANGCEHICAALNDEGLFQIKGIQTDIGDGDECGNDTKE
ncbi:hypothetical protein DPMN_120525 [Dreissena polymorpha]|uniref:Uncharacterized protein n=1 Tax=Dreissena polymorpha TaxID=45954 RepID=A0A9D4GKD2_DREPO|nr:hypothetical protein DPMN_120525 [Dreissena polymorpha]